MAKAFCGSGCRQSYREDKRAGAIYGDVLTCEKNHRHSVLMADGCWTRREDFCKQIGRCCYCGADTKKKATA